jgi:hypothetical protein
MTYDGEGELAEVVVQLGGEQLAGSVSDADPLAVARDGDALVVALRRRYVCVITTRSERVDRFTRLNEASCARTGLRLVFPVVGGQIYERPLGAGDVPQIDVAARLEGKEPLPEARKVDVGRAQSEPGAHITNMRKNSILGPTFFGLRAPARSKCVGQYLRVRLITRAPRCTDSESTIAVCCTTSSTLSKALILLMNSIVSPSTAEK